MRIETIKAYRVLQPFVDGPYNMSKGRRADAFDAVIVAISVRHRPDRLGRDGAARQFLFAGLRGRRARRRRRDRAASASARIRARSTRFGRLMDTVFKGHPYIKSALDMACWDLAARAADVPLVTLSRRPRQRHGRALQGGHPRPGRGDGGHCRAHRRRGFQSPAGQGRRQCPRRHRARACGRRRGAQGHRDLLRRQCRLDDLTRRCNSPMRRATSTTRSNSHAPRSTRTPSVRRALDKPMVLDESAASLDDVLEIHRRGAGRRADAEDLAAGRRRQDAAGPRPRRRPRLHDHRRGYRRRRDRHGRHGASVAVDAGRTPAACHRLPRMGDGAHRLQHAAGHRQPHGRPRRTRPRHRGAARIARRAVPRTERSRPA